MRASSEGGCAGPEGRGKNVWGYLRKKSALGQGGAGNAAKNHAPRRRGVAAAEAGSRVGSGGVRQARWGGDNRGCAIKNAA